MGREAQLPPEIPNATYLGYLGKGGFSDVFLYRQHMPERDVAVKVLLREAGTERSGAFEAEANLMAKMSAHPNILSVFNAGVTEDGRPYIVMEYCPPPHGGDLATEGRLSVGRVLEMSILLAGAVETLHRSGILHRDLKPKNILMTQFGHPVLTDFGIASSTEPGEERVVSGFSLPWTPPEQAQGETNIGSTADVYSLAATIYTFLAGHSPVEIPGGDNREVAMLNRVFNAPVPRTGRQDVPMELERILAIAMAKDPRQRYQTVEDFAYALQQVQASLHQSVTRFDVMETPVYHRHEDDDDATNLRPIQIIDPGRIDLKDEVVSSQEGTGAGENSTNPSSAPYTPTDLSSDSQENETPGQAEKPATTQQSLGRKMSVGLGLVVAIILFGVWTALQGTGRSFSQPNDDVPSSPADLPVAVELDIVTGLSGHVEGDKVRFSWEYETDEAVFLYTLVDPLETHPVHETRKKSVLVEQQPSRTCLEVMVKDSNGKTSSPVTECVNTP
ncbi:MAG: serine/threonine-protein kinase [Ancrocorticia sp.]